MELNNKEQLDIILKHCNEMPDENPNEEIANDEWVAELRGLKCITVPNRLSSGELDSKNPVKRVAVSWLCPYCNKPMGEPTLIPILVGGKMYMVSSWTNPCGHEVKYNDLVPKDELPEFYKR